MTTLTQALESPDLLGPHYIGASWARWKAILKAADGEPLSMEEAALFQEVAQRDPPKAPVKELVACVGRRGGKDSIAAGIATFIAAFCDFRPYLRPGERASVVCLATDRTQAKIVHRYISGYFQKIPLLRALVVSDTEDEIVLANGAEIVVATANFRSLRGRTIACVIFDELAFWRSEETANPDIEIDAAVDPAMATLPGARKIMISTVYRKSGLLYDRFRRYFGKDDPDTLVVLGTTRQFNSTISQRIIDAALERDEEAAGAEWLSIWRSDLTDLFDRQTIEAAVEPGLAVRPPRSFHSYRAFCDPSGGRGDSFAAAIAHDEGNLVVLDHVFERRAPFDPHGVVDEIAAILKAYGVSQITGDRYAASWCSLAFEKAGISYVDSERDKSKIFLDALPIFTAGLARIADNRRLVSQLCGLERKVSRVGRDIISHPPGGNDDIANAACGALTLVTARPESYLWDFTPDLAEYFAQHPLEEALR